MTIRTFLVRYFCYISIPFYTIYSPLFRFSLYYWYIANKPIVVTMTVLFVSDAVYDVLMILLFPPYDIRYSIRDDDGTDDVFCCVVVPWLSIFVWYDMAVMTTVYSIFNDILLIPACIRLQIISPCWLWYNVEELMILTIHYIHSYDWYIRLFPFYSTSVIIVDDITTVSYSLLIYATAMLLLYCSSDSVRIDCYLLAVTNIVPMPTGAVTLRCILLYDIHDIYILHWCIHCRHHWWLHIVPL